MHYFRIAISIRAQSSNVEYYWIFDALRLFDFVIRVYAFTISMENLSYWGIQFCIQTISQEEETMYTRFKRALWGELRISNAYMNDIDLINYDPRDNH